ncbi:hypothetical protein BU23DRAFT_567686 [Bimuria novae-zelandiae CBS 107.79]|uniref:Uncharacterized protein n=1 Tax=Bimuria novae-zelandiae CBS 107.79 TaxID=1447943 RepID=A0A6A5VCT2_9PLEO|nr:hypothetical protein BU23DRAFT_567686 [Bimuria novae-zelandiae CBS 107.79]
MIGRQWWAVLFGSSVTLSREDDDQSMWVCTKYREAKKNVCVNGSACACSAAHINNSGEYLSIDDGQIRPVSGQSNRGWRREAPSKTAVCAWNWGIWPGPVCWNGSSGALALAAASRAERRLVRPKSVPNGKAGTPRPSCLL